MQTINSRSVKAPAPRTLPPRAPEPVKPSRIVKTVDETETSTFTGLGKIIVHIEFKLRANGEKSAAVAGNFNGWDAKKTPLKKNGDFWTTTVDLPRGRYEYRFVVDGKWVSDSTAKEVAPNPFGSHNSVLIV